MTRKKNDEVKEAECPDETSPVEIEEGVNDKKDDKDKNIMRGKRQNSQMTLTLLILRKF